MHFERSNETQSTWSRKVCKMGTSWRSMAQRLGASLWRLHRGDIVPFRCRMQRSSAARWHCGGTTEKYPKILSSRANHGGLAGRRKRGWRSRSRGCACHPRDVDWSKAPHGMDYLGRVVPCGGGQQQRPCTTTSSFLHLYAYLLDAQNKLTYA